MCVCCARAPHRTAARFRSGGRTRRALKINADDKPSCAASATITPDFLFHDVDMMKSYLAATIAATPAGDSSQCPPVATKLPKYTGEHGADDDSPYVSVSGSATEVDDADRRR